MRPHHHLATLLALAALLLTSGCAHYKLAEDSTAPFRSIYVEPVANRSYAPQAQALLTRQLVDAFQQDGAVAVAASPEAADAVLSVTLESYDRALDATDPDDTGVARSFELGLTARATLLNQADGTAYFRDRRYTVKEAAYTHDGLIQAEYQTMPVLTLNLSKSIKDSVLGTW